MVKGRRGGGGGGGGGGQSFIKLLMTVAIVRIAQMQLGKIRKPVLDGRTCIRARALQYSDYASF